MREGDGNASSAGSRVVGKGGANKMKLYMRARTAYENTDPARTATVMAADRLAAEDDPVPDPEPDPDPPGEAVEVVLSGVPDVVVLPLMRRGPSGKQSQRECPEKKKKKRKS